MASLYLPMHLVSACWHGLCHSHGLFYIWFRKVHNRNQMHRIFTIACCIFWNHPPFLLSLWIQQWSIMHLLAPIFCWVLCHAFTSFQCLSFKFKYWPRSRFLMMVCVRWLWRWLLNLTSLLWVLWVVKDVNQAPTALAYKRWLMWRTTTREQKNV